MNTNELFEIAITNREFHDDDMQREYALFVKSWQYDFVEAVNYVVDYIENNVDNNPEKIFVSLLTERIEDILDRGIYPEDRTTRHGLFAAKFIEMMSKRLTVNVVFSLTF